MDSNFLWLVAAGAAVWLGLAAYLIFMGCAQRRLDARLAQRHRLLLHHLPWRDPTNSTSWIDVRSPSLILSNSSMQQIPVSARISAPPSTFSSSVSGSRITPAVNPTLDDPLPYTSLFPAIPTVV